MPFLLLLRRLRRLLRPCRQSQSRQHLVHLHVQLSGQSLASRKIRAKIGLTLGFELGVMCNFFKQLLLLEASFQKLLDPVVSSMSIRLNGEKSTCTYLFPALGRFVLPAMSDIVAQFSVQPT